ncbi:MAG: formylglycine-generating enzyme family protein [Proteobacteria bacterium]|nr:formylglycine-generating enzyme family protein [Pseudomonadota bacterium]
MWWLIILGCTSSTPSPSDTVDTSVAVQDSGDSEDTQEDSADTGKASDSGDTGDTSPVLAEPWVYMPGSTFWMGTEAPADQTREEPRHQVTVPSFAIMRHEATMGEYTACEDAGGCTARPDSCYDNSNPNLPANCLDYAQAGAFCSWFGGRLPTESEWEYAATSRGTDAEYPWGNEAPDCTRVNVGDGQGTASCNSEGVWEVCTHPLGNTSDGICEMGGNVYEWVEDWYWSSYTDHPTDGSARTDMNNEFRVMRGGAIGSGAPPRSRHRNFHPPDFWYGGMGVRCVKDL